MAAQRGRESNTNSMIHRSRLPATPAATRTAAAAANGRAQADDASAVRRRSHFPSLSRWHTDLLLVLALFCATYAVSGHYNIAETLRRLTRPYEYLQLDELPGALLVTALGLIWVAWRRNREARHALLQRQAAEARLAETLVEKNRLAARFIDTQEAERRNLARELHDELGQYLNAIKLDATAIARHAREPLQQRHAQTITESIDRVHRVVQSMIRRFRPVALDELGLSAALESNIAHWQQRMPGTELRLGVTGDLGSCGEQVNLAIYRMVQEALTNISRHARAQRVDVRLARRAAPRDEVCLLIEDDGVGTDLHERGTGLGLVGMRERAELLGGTFDVSSQPGHGFRLAAVLPVGDAAPVRGIQA